MLESLNPIQQVLLGISVIGCLFTLLVIYLSSSTKFANTDRLENTFNSSK